MDIDVVRADRLTSAHRDAWTRLQAADSTLHSPFFHPEFTVAVGAVRDDVEVAVLKEDGEFVGFFPFQRRRPRIACPVGGELSDFHGLVLRQGVAPDVGELLGACRLSAWHFHGLIASQEPLRPYHSIICDSPCMDVRQGFAAYCQARQKAGCGRLAKLEYSRRRIEREVGPIRLEPHTDEQRLFDLLLRWKVEQYQRIGARNCLASAWVVALLDRIRRIQGPGFAGVLSVMYAGGRPAALHLGMRYDGVLHAWYPTYDRDLAKYSPGLVFWLEMLRACEGLAIHRIDLGKGQEPYKAHFRSGGTPVAEGSIDVRPLARSLRRGWICTRELIRTTPLHRPGRAVMRYARNWLIPQDS